jgi:hypothetical protein
VIFIRLWARERSVGKAEAIEKPNPNVPSHVATVGFGHNSITTTLTRHPARSPIKMGIGLRRAEIGIAANRPSVRAPQKAEVRYAADVLSPRPSARA